MTESLTYFEDGWLLWSRSRGGTTEGLRVYAQLYADKEGDRGEIAQLAIIGRNLTTEKLRSIPLGHIETMANTAPGFGPHIAGTPQGPMGEAFNKVPQQANRHMLALAARKQRQPLSRPDGTNPEAFYQQVADAYRDAVQGTNKVAKVLAEEAGVPVTTVHRWILEARRRGFLPPARKGRIA